MQRFICMVWCKVSLTLFCNSSGLCSTAWLSSHQFPNKESMGWLPFPNLPWDLPQPRITYSPALAEVDSLLTGLMGNLLCLGSLCLLSHSSYVRLMQCQDCSLPAPLTLRGFSNRNHLVVDMPSSRVYVGCCC